MRAVAAISLAGLGACADASADVSRASALPVYGGVETRPLDEDLVNVRVALSGNAEHEDATAYARCAAAQYTVFQGFGFLRHIRTTVDPTEGGLTADAIYTLSPDVPAGTTTIDAAVTVADCAASGIPTV